MLNVPSQLIFHLSDLQRLLTKGETNLYDTVDANSVYCIHTFMQPNQKEALKAFFEKAKQKAQQIGDWAFADECALMLGEKAKPSEFQRPIWIDPSDR